MHSNLSSRRWLSVLSVVVLSFAFTGCFASAHPRAVYVDGIATYPYTYYDGHPVYWAHGHWYYRQGPRWVYYSAPPPALRQHHHVYERAPRAHSRQPRERVVVAPRARRTR